MGLGLPFLHDLVSFQGFAFFFFVHGEGRTGDGWCDGAVLPDGKARGGGGERFISGLILLGWWFTGLITGWVM